MTKEFQIPNDKLSEQKIQQKVPKDAKFGRQRKERAMAEHGDPRNGFSDFKERSTQFMRTVFSAGRSLFAFQRRAGLRAVRKEFRKRGAKVKFLSGLD
jgi:hypothetical protein